MIAEKPWIVVMVLAVLAAPAALHAQTIGTAFTYQGQLKKSGKPLNDTADFQFSLWTADVGGSQVGSTLAVNNQNVVNGLFTVQLDFGADAFNGEDARWLDIAVRSPAGSGGFTTLTPRQRLTPAPYALQTRGITVDSDGDVGIGKTNPTYKLDVHGIIRTTFGGVLFPDGSFQTTAIRSLSPRGVAEFTDVGPNTWVAPDGVYTVLVELWGGSGGGGGGGSCQTPGAGSGGGGGAGGYIHLVVDVTPGQAYTVRIGSGGAAGAGGVDGGPGGDGTDGTPTQFEAPDGTILASAGAGEGGQGGGGCGGPGGAGGAGGTVDPLDGMARPGLDGWAGDDPESPRRGGHTAAGTISPPHAGDYSTTGTPSAAQWGQLAYFAVYLLGGDGADGFYCYEVGCSGYPGDDGYAVLHW